MAAAGKRGKGLRIRFGDLPYEERPSLYGLMHEQHKEIRKKSLLHRLILLAKISPELADKRDLTEYWEQLFISLQRYYQGEGVTGLLLLYPSYAIHILESSSDVLYSILRDLKEMKYQGDRVMVMEPRILVLSHNIPNRLFQEWRCNLVDAPDKKTPFHGGPTECIINECITKILKLGMHMHMQAKTATGTSDSIPEKALELLIPQAAICYLLECDELLTPELFLQAYDCPLNIIMDSGHVFGSDNTSSVSSVASTCSHKAS
ncbi:testis-expressed protein 47 isoform X1 [Microcaecilia unicolor]|uniref:Testis-expressed protein 47-like isoform X1 n=1 Tax=Microcaecilia unicolor TaxID=1415580 RepID=A0A6P7YHF2_9AMPH|nr:testis-expressed protein 47-like isoform X1 [Microcaecilia unicolor]